MTDFFEKLFAVFAEQPISLFCKNKRRQEVNNIRRNCLLLIMKKILNRQCITWFTESIRF